MSAARRFHSSTIGVTGERPVLPSLIAEDAFTDANGTALEDHTSDSNHSWVKIVGTTYVTANEARVAIAPYHYVFDLSAETKQPKEIALEIGDTNAATQRIEFTTRDAGDGLNYVRFELFGDASASTLSIYEIVGGVSTSKGFKFKVGDYTNNVDLLKVIVTDVGGVVTIDASAIEPSLVLSWTGAGFSTSRSVGLFATANRITNRHDNLTVKA